MKIPKALKIGQHTITIIEKPLNEIDSECNGGWARWEQNEIWIANDIPQSRKEEIFLHEIFHFINIYLTEEQCCYLSGLMYQILKDNDLLK